MLQRFSYISLYSPKGPGIDGIIVFWYKSLHLYRKELALLFNKAFNGLLDNPDWLTRALTRLLLKNNDTENPKNYQSIACQNTMLQLYTNSINHFF